MIEKLIEGLKSISDQKLLNYCKGSRNESTYLANGLRNLNEENFVLEFRIQNTKKRVDLVIFRNERISLALELKVRHSHHLFANKKYIGFAGDVEKLQLSSLNNLMDDSNKNKYFLLLIQHIYSQDRIIDNWNEINQMYNNRVNGILPREQQSSLILTQLKKRINDLIRELYLSENERPELIESGFIKKDTYHNNLEIGLISGLVKIP